MELELDQNCTEAGRKMDKNWTKTRANLNQIQTKTGLELDQNWTETGPKVEQIWTRTRLKLNKTRGILD